MGPSSPARAKPAFSRPRSRVLACRCALTAVLATLSAAGSAAPAAGQDVRLAPILGGFLFVFAVVIVFVGIRRRRRDKDVFDAIDDFIEGDGASSASGDGGGGD